MGRLLLELLELTFEELLETLTGKSSSSTYSIVWLLELLTLTGTLSTGNKTLLLVADDDDELDCMGVSLFLFGIGSLLPLALLAWLVCRDLGKSASTSSNKLLNNLLINDFCFSFSSDASLVCREYSLSAVLLLLLSHAGLL